MLKLLLELCNQNKRGSIYTNMQDTSKFHFGNILAVNDKEYAMYMISPNGTFDGIMLKPTSSVYRIEIDGQYSLKMEKLCSSTQMTLFEEKIDPLHIKESLLSIAYKTQKIVSLELVDSGYNDIVGFVVKIQDDQYQIKEVDEYGFEDGYSFIMIDDITQIRYASEDEELILRLWKSNY